MNTSKYRICVEVLFENGHHMTISTENRSSKHECDELAGCIRDIIAAAYRETQGSCLRVNNTLINVPKTVYITVSVEKLSNSND